MSECDKRRVFIALYHGAELSLAENRRQLHHAAYHCAVLISPKYPFGRDCHVYDIANGPIQDVAHQIDTWRFREKGVNPDGSQYLIGMIMIGKAPARVTTIDIATNLGPSLIPIPDKDHQQNCDTWNRAAIKRLQEGSPAGRVMDDFIGPNGSFSCDSES